MKILILCTGNSCRSQMAHGILQSLDKNISVYSGGTEPAAQVNRQGRRSDEGDRNRYQLARADSCKHLSP